MLTHLLLAGSSIVLAACATPTSSVQPATSQRVELSVRSAIHFRDRSRRPLFERARWERTPSQERLDAIYRDLPRGLFGQFDCEVAADRSLRDCRSDRMDTPPDPGAEPILLELTREFRLAADSPPPADISYVSLGLWLRKGDEQAVCPSNFCVLHRAPPPPPPPARDAPDDPNPHISQALEAEIVFRDGSRAPFHERAEWADLPSPDALLTAYSGGAISGDASGMVTCLVGRERRLESCRLDNVDPSDRGFEPLLLQTAHSLTIQAPSTLLDQIREIRLMIRFSQGLGPD